jgi:elongation factor Ts
MAVSMDTIKSLREETGAGVMDVKKALEEAHDDVEKAKAIIRERGMARAEKKADRETKEGFVGSYIHTTGKVASIVSLLCETDFVARNEEFRALARELAMHVASMRPESIEELLEQEHVRDSRIIREMVKELSGKVGENITIGEFKLIVI